MSTTINQKAYLQKYLSGPSGDKKKKKKKAVKGTGFKIIDDDIDLSKLRHLDNDELDILDQGEDAPQIAGIIDERPEEVRKAEQFSSSSKWKVINQDDGFNSKLEIEEIKRDVKHAEKENELIFGKMYSDSEDEKKNDSDLSPPRKQGNDEPKKNKKSSNKHNSDSDFSPPRKRDDKSPNRKKYDKSPKRKSDESPKRRSEKSSKKRSDNNSHRRDRNRKDDSDASPPRSEKPKERIRKPSRWGDFSPESKSQSIRDHSPSTTDGRNSSPSRKSRRDSPKRRFQGTDASPPRKSKNYDSDASPPRRSKKDYDSDHSPPRKSRKNYDSPPKKSRKNNDSDQSPPRKSKGDTRNHNTSKEFVPPTKKRQYSPQKQSYDRNKVRNDRPDSSSRHDKPRKQRYSSDSDMSPPRKNKQQKSASPFRKYKPSNHQSLDNNKRKYNSDSDQSPIRRERDRNNTERDRSKKDNDSPPPSNKKMARTLEGKMAGLQDARQLRQENENFRKREEEVFNKMTDDVSGRNAQVVSRKSKRETSEDRQKQKEKAERQKELDEKYKKWSKGVKQIEDQEARVQEFLHESSKPLARLRDDRDLEDNLRQVERDGDPMLQYIRDKKRERGELGPEKPSYKGSFPPNRFNIRPGYRWDGVDRSNGYEKKFFEQQSKRKAQEEEAYKWSTEDL